MPSRQLIDLTKLSGRDPSAVLLVESSTRSIVFANRVARQLVPHIGLPLDLDEWSKAADLKDVEGFDLAGSDNPLSNIARAEPVSGVAVSAARSSDIGARRETMWVVSIPLSGAPRLDDHALVVFLPLADRNKASNAAEAARTNVELRERAVLATGLSFTVADARADDLPLIWVNPAFTATTGYSFSEVAGKNCRFLQGRGTDQQVRRQMREALDSGEALTTTLLNYRKDGSAFWNQVSMNPIYDASGHLTHFVGIQTDVTGSVEANLERDRALAAEQAARSQLAVLAEVTAGLAATADVDGLVRRTAELAVPTLGDWSLVAINDDKGAFQQMYFHRHDEERGVQDILDEVESALATTNAMATVTSNLPATIRVRNAKDASFHRIFGDELIRLFDHLDTESMIAVAMPGRDDVAGFIVLGRSNDRDAFTPNDEAVAEDFGRRAGLVVENTRLHKTEHDIAETLQRALLPELPKLTNVDAAARYRPGTTSAAVGGDFYDVIQLPNGVTSLVVGDVMGHDMSAAAAMGQIRGLLRAYVWEDNQSGEQPDPARVISRIDRLLDGLEIPAMATIAFATLQVLGDSRWNFRYTDAGHPPFVLVRPDGVPELLQENKNTMVGVGDAERDSISLELESGTLLIAYTDGLIERRDEDLDESFARLLETVSKAPREPESLCDHLLTEFPTSDDDVALVAIRLR